MKYIKTYESYDDIKSQIMECFYDLVEDYDFRVEIDEKEFRTNYFSKIQGPGFLVFINRRDMSEHQTAFNKTPATSFMSIQSIYRPGLLRNIGVVWKHLDKRNEIDYNRLLSKVGKGCGKVTIQWRPVWKVKGN